MYQSARNSTKRIIAYIADHFDGEKKHRKNDLNCDNINALAKIYNKNFGDPLEPLFDTRNARGTSELRDNFLLAVREGKICDDFWLTESEHLHPTRILNASSAKKYNPLLTESFIQCEEETANTPVPGNSTPVENENTLLQLREEHKAKSLANLEKARQLIVSNHPTDNTDIDPPIEFYSIDQEDETPTFKPPRPLPNRNPTHVAPRFGPAGRFFVIFTAVAVLSPGCRPIVVVAAAPS